MTDTGLGNIDNFSGDGVRRRGPMARALVGDIVQLVDFILVIAVSVGVAYAYHSLALQSVFDVQYYIAAGIIGATGLTALLRRDGYYEFDQLLSSGRSLRAIFSRWGLVLLGLLAFGFALKVSEHFSRAWLGLWSVFTVMAITGVRVIAARLLRQMSRDGGAFARRVAVVGATALGAKFAAQASAPDSGILIAGVYEAGLADNGDGHFAEIKGDLSDLAQASRNSEIDDIVIATPRASKEEMARLIRKLSMLPVSIAICPNMHWLDHTGGAIARVGDASVASSAAAARSQMYEGIA